MAHSHRSSMSFCLVCIVVMAAAAALLQPASSQQAVPDIPNLKVGSNDRSTTLKCTNIKSNKTTCSATCNARCPHKCLIQCPSCKTFCLCDFYPGVSCGDPRFTGADGNNFYFHGKKDRDFCIVSDAALHINAHFIGKRNPAMSRDFTWIQALGIRFAHHHLYVAAQRTPRWDAAADHLALALDDEDVDVASLLPRFVGARWSPPTAPALSVTRTARVNTVVVELRGAFRIVASVVPITAEDSRIHNYGVREDDGDTLAHLDLGFKFYDLTDDVHGVLGQTYRPDYVNSLNVTSNMPVMGGAPDYLSSDLFSTDCAVARFGGRRHQQATAANIAMLTDDDDME
uniref:Root cap protein 1 n=1 Tax=Zea mays TaxID=4577 RepID=Q9ZQT2_MAIZE|nr:root cap protein 1 [Zea mays]|eukprot:NP_001104848.1 root cap protein 1 precursor [Zea mays]